MLDVVVQCDFITGHAVVQFEEAFAAFLGCECVVGVSNGLDALRLTLLALGIIPGDEVIVPVNTFIATACAVTSIGARPIFVDCREDTHLLDLDRIASAVTSRTRAVIPVHLTGHCVDMPALLELAEDHGFVVVEDAAQAHGAQIAGRAAGTWAKAGCFSFYPAKNLGACGDAGAIATNDRELASKMRCLRDYGQKAKYDHVMPGLNARLDTVQAAVLNVKLPHLSAWNQARKTLAAGYRSGLQGAGDLRLQRPAPASTHVYHLFVAETESRDRLRDHLAKQGITTGVHYPKPLHLQPAFEYLGYRRGSFPVSERLARRIISLPLCPELRADEQQRIIGAIHNFFSTF